MIKISSINKVDIDAFDEIWVICRSINKLPLRLSNCPKVKHVPELSPENELFYEYLNWKKTDRWNFDIFKKYYVPKFIESIRANFQAKKLLEELAAISHEKDIALVCFCPDEKMCHRSIIAGLLINLNADIKCNLMYDCYKL